MTRFTEIVPHISFDWLDAPYEDFISTKACFIDMLFDRLWSNLNFEGFTYAV